MVPSAGSLRPPLMGTPLDVVAGFVTCATDMAFCTHAPCARENRAVPTLPRPAPPRRAPAAPRAPNSQSRPATARRIAPRARGAPPPRTPETATASCRGAHTRWRGVCTRGGREARAHRETALAAHTVGGPSKCVRSCVWEKGGNSAHAPSAPHAHNSPRYDAVARQRSSDASTIVEQGRAQ